MNAADETTKFETDRTNTQTNKRKLDDNFSLIGLSEDSDDDDSSPRSINTKKGGDRFEYINCIQLNNETTMTFEVRNIGKINFFFRYTVEPQPMCPMCIAIGTGFLISFNFCRLFSHSNRKKKQSSISIKHIKTLKYGFHTDGKCL